MEANIYWCMHAFYFEMFLSLWIHGAFLFLDNFFKCVLLFS